MLGVFERPFGLASLQRVLGDRLLVGKLRCFQRELGKPEGGLGILNFLVDVFGFKPDERLPLGDLDAVVEQPLDLQRANLLRVGDDLVGPHSLHESRDVDGLGGSSRLCLSFVSSSKTHRGKWESENGSHESRGNEPKRKTHGRPLKLLRISRKTVTSSA